MCTTCVPHRLSQVQSMSDTRVHLSESVRPSAPHKWCGWCVETMRKCSYSPFLPPIHMFRHTSQPVSMDLKHTVCRGLHLRVALFFSATAAAACLHIMLCTHICRRYFCRSFPPPLPACHEHETHTRRIRLLLRLAQHNVLLTLWFFFSSFFSFVAILPDYYNVCCVVCCCR